VRHPVPSEGPPYILRWSGSLLDLRSSTPRKSDAYVCSQFVIEPARRPWYARFEGKFQSAITERRTRSDG
jgi:hypothetical protein